MPKPELSILSAHSCKSPASVSGAAIYPATWPQNRVFSNSSFLPLSCHGLSVAKTGQSDAHISQLSVHLLSLLSLWPQDPHQCPSLHPLAQSTFYSRLSEVASLFSETMPASPHCLQDRTPTMHRPSQPFLACFTSSSSPWASHGLRASQPR